MKNDTHNFTTENKVHSPIFPIHKAKRSCEYATFQYKNAFYLSMILLYVKKVRMRCRERGVLDYIVACALTEVYSHRGESRGKFLEDQLLPAVSRWELTTALESVNIWPSFSEEVIINRPHCVTDKKILLTKFLNRMLILLV